MSAPRMPEPTSVAMDVENFVNTEHDQAKRHDNRSVLDDDGAYRLHQLAAHIYALGHADGVDVQMTRDGGQRMRERAAAVEAVVAGGDES